jgi:hypothetical protein
MLLLGSQLLIGGHPRFQRPMIPNRHFLLLLNKEVYAAVSY